MSVDTIEGICEISENCVRWTAILVNKSLYLVYNTSHPLEWLVQCCISYDSPMVRQFLSEMSVYLCVNDFESIFEVLLVFVGVSF